MPENAGACVVQVQDVGAGMARTLGRATADESRNALCTFLNEQVEPQRFKRNQLFDFVIAFVPVVLSGLLKRYQISVLISAMLLVG